MNDKREQQEEIAIAVVAVLAMLFVFALLANYL